MKKNEEERRWTKDWCSQMTKEVWQALQKVVMLETNPLELRKKIDLANIAIHERIDELANNQDINSTEERQQIMDALSDFPSLQRRNSETPVATASSHETHEGAV